MSHGLIGFFARLSGRERAMIAVLVAFVLPFALIQGVALPLIARQEAARAAVSHRRIDLRHVAVAQPANPVIPSHHLRHCPGGAAADRPGWHGGLPVLFHPSLPFVADAVSSGQCSDGNEYF